jgi:hypothetical protein
MSSATSAPTAPGRVSSRTAKLALLAAVVMAAAVVLLLVLRGDDEKAADGVVLGKPKIVSPGGLSTYARSAGRPVYWAGPAAAGFQLELTEVRGGRTYVRYLPAGVRAGDPRPGFTTVATYPLAGAYARTSKSRSRPGAVLRRSPAGAAVLYYRKAPSNVYVAYPNVDSLLEVFAPQPRAAQRLARSESIVPVR